MNNNQSKTDLSNQYFRPKRLYVTSEDVSDFDNAGSCRFILKEPILPAEGFKLVYGLSSFGYSATAYNLSTAQKNNSLCFKLTYLTPEKVYDPVSHSWTTEEREEKFCYQKLTIPDGYYGTLDQLFAVFTNLQLGQIKTGLRIDVTKPLVTSTSSILSNPPNESSLTMNDIPFVISFTSTLYGFQIDVSIFQDNLIINDYYNLYDEDEPADHYQAYQVNNIPLVLEIVPGDETTRKLYNLLFTNENDLPDKVVNIPTSLSSSNQNPPASIIFQLQCPLQYDEDSTNPIDSINPMDDFHYFVLTSDQDKVELAKLYVKDPFDGSHTELSAAAVTNSFIMYQDVPFKSYYPPRLFPLYIEISTNLETQNLTVDGYNTNLLCRHFPLGADQGALSFFQSWDNPVMHHARSSRHTIDGLKIDFLSESSKWSFFNLTFFLKLCFMKHLKKKNYLNLIIKYLKFHQKTQ